MAKELLKSIEFLGEGEAIATRFDGSKLHLIGCRVESVGISGLEKKGAAVIETEIRLNKDRN